MIATKNRWRCPSCENRFKTKLELDLHFEDNDVCDEYQRELLLTLKQACYIGDNYYWRKYTDLIYNSPKNIFKRM